MIPATYPIRSDDGATRRRDIAVAAIEVDPRRDGRSRLRAGYKPGKSLVERVEKDLARNFGEQLTLRDIEKSSGYSVYQIIRAFRRRLGITPHAYLVRMRLDYAAEMLLQGDSIAGAAAEAGFSDQSHMTRHFKRAFGITPKQYLLNMHGGAERHAAGLLS